LHADPAASPVRRPSSAGRISARSRYTTSSAAASAPAAASRRPISGARGAPAPWASSGCRARSPRTGGAPARHCEAPRRTWRAPGHRAPPEPARAVARADIGPPDSTL
jgi:hypothetical protein